MGGKGLEGSWAASAQRGVKLERLPSTPLADISVHSPTQKGQKIPGT
jgi:hypothetical protein